MEKGQMKAQKTGQEAKKGQQGWRQEVFQVKEPLGSKSTGDKPALGLLPS